MKNNITYFFDTVRKYLRDILLAFILATIAGLASYLGAHRVDSTIIPFDAWFDADIPRVIGDMSEKWANHSRTNVHPLFPLLTWPPVYLLKTKLGISGLTAIRLVVAAVASIWISVMFITLRLLGCQRLDASIFTVLAGTSAAAVFWFTVPEAYPFGSLSILLALCLVGLAQHRKLPESYFTVINAITMSMTITNWIAGILATVTYHHWKRSLQIIANGFCLVVILWTIQKYLFPSANFFLGDRQDESYTTLGGSLLFRLQVFLSFFYHTMVMPAIQEVHFPKDVWPTRILTQNSLPGSAGKLGVIAVLIWTGLLGLGFWALFYLDKYKKFRIVLGFTILGQLVLFFLYGSETFLYSLNFAPLLFILTALSTLTPARPLALILAVGLILTAGYNNSIQFKKAIDFVEEHHP